jgi:hypothetical protein
MSGKPNPKRLVLRRDTATGMTLVGWDEDLPSGRFEHLALICESARNILPECDSEEFTVYQNALQKAREANRIILEQQSQHYQSKGWFLIPFELAHNQEAMQADNLGIFTTAAIQLHYQLTQNRMQAWVVVQQERVVHVRARYPKKALDELTYQVWYHKQLRELSEIAGTLLEGRLIICKSGLWFEANNDYPL